MKGSNALFSIFDSHYPRFFPSFSFSAHLQRLFNFCWRWSNTFQMNRSTANFAYVQCILHNICYGLQMPAYSITTKRKAAIAMMNADQPKKIRRAVYEFYSLHLSLFASVSILPLSLSFKCHHHQLNTLRSLYKQHLAFGHILVDNKFTMAVSNWSAT